LRRIVAILAGFFLLAFIAVPVFASSFSDSNHSEVNTTPWIIVDPIGDKYLGDSFNITGTTNLEEGTEVRVTVSALIRCMPHGPCPEFPYYGTMGTAEVVKGDNGLNKTQFFVNASDFVVEDYYVQIDAGSNIIGAGNFRCTGPPNPFVTIDPIGNHTKGEIFYINGTTNIYISNVSWILFLRKQGSDSDSPPEGEYVHLPVTVITSNISGVSRWSANATDAAKDLVSGDYMVLSGVNRVAATTENFTLYSNGTDSTLKHVPLAQILSSTPNPSETMPKKASGYTAVITLVSLCLALVFLPILIR